MGLEEIVLEDLKPGESRALMLSDAHLYESEDPLHRKPEGLHTFTEKLMQMFIYRAIQKGEEAFIRILEEASLLSAVAEADFIFCGGDMVTGYGERGLVGLDSSKHIASFKQLMEGHFHGKPIKYAAGGHEVGYVLPLSFDPEGGISKKSIQVFEHHFNQLFYTFTLGQYKFIVLSSDLELFPGEKSELVMLRELQREFYQDEITYAYRGQRVVLMLHDPDALVPMFPFLSKNRYKIEMAFSGHQHAQWVHKIYPKVSNATHSRFLGATLKPMLSKFFSSRAEKVWEYFRRSQVNAPIWKALNLCVVPSPGGMMGIGGGYLVADFKEDSIVTKKLKTPRPEK